MGWHLPSYGSQPFEYIPGCLGAQITLNRVLASPDCRISTETDDRR